MTHDDGSDDSAAGSARRRQWPARGAEIKSPHPELKGSQLPLSEWKPPKADDAPIFVPCEERRKMNP